MTYSVVRLRADRKIPGGRSEMELLSMFRVVSDVKPAKSRGPNSVRLLFPRYLLCIASGSLRTHLHQHVDVRKTNVQKSGNESFSSYQFLTSWFPTFE